VSSRAYVAEIRSSPTLRRLLVASALLLALLGLLCLLLLPLAPAWVVSAALLWLLINARQITSLRRHYITFSHMRFNAGGKVELLARGRPPAEAVILPGSVLLAGIGWIRLRIGDAASVAEPVSRETQESKQWRRLQVIWRHL
jgi:hypothetical protein